MIMCEVNSPHNHTYGTASLVSVGWVGQDQERYEVVGHLPGYWMTCFRKLSDEIRLSSSQYTLCFFPTYFNSLVFFLKKSEFSLRTLPLPVGGFFFNFTI